jgi:NitT/TauT family transport system substrate-binding protein
MRTQLQTYSPSRRKLIKVTAAAGAAAAVGLRPRYARAATEKITFQLDWIPFGRHAPYYAALENGFYREKGLDVVILQGRSTIQGIRTLLAGQSQFIFQDIAVMLSVRAEEGAKIKALACMYQKSPHTLFYLKNNRIVKPKDIEGKKIAFTPGDSPKRMFPAFAKANGIDESMVDWLSVDPNSKNAVLLNHQVQGMVTYIFTLPVLQKAAQNGDQVGSFVYSDYGADFYSNGIGALEAFIKEKPEVTRNFVQGTMRGLRFTLDHPREAVEMLKKHQPQLDEDVALREIDILQNIAAPKDLKVLGSITKEKMQETQELMTRYMDLKRPVNIDDAFTNEYLT